MNIIPTRRFDGDLRKLVKNNPRLLVKIDKSLGVLSINMNHPSLRVHKLANLDLYSISVDMKIRILFYFEDEDIYLVRIGSHDDVY